MNYKSALISASVFAMSGLVPVAHATGLDDVCNIEITEDTKVDESGEFTGECRIKVIAAKLEIVGVTIAINNTSPEDNDGELRIDDETEDEGAAELVIKNAKIKTGDRLRIEGAWDGGVTFKNNHVNTGDDLRVKPVGSANLIFKNNRGQVVDDIRLGDVIKDDNDDVIGGLDGDMDVRNNRITLLDQVDPDPDEPGTEFVVQSFDGGINVKNNRLNRVERIDITSSGSGDTRVKNNGFRNTETSQEILVSSEEGDVSVKNNRLNRVERIDITSSGSGDASVKNNRFRNTETDQEITITSEDGDVSVKNNRFGQSVNPVEIESTMGECESKRNRPNEVNTLACFL